MEKYAEQNLWKAVIVHAWREAIRSNKNERAHEWFKRDNRNFRLVCELAGLDPDFVCRLYTEYFTKNKKIK